MDYYFLNIDTPCPLPECKGKLHQIFAFKKWEVQGPRIVGRARYRPKGKDDLDPQGHCCDTCRVQFFHDKKKLTQEEVLKVIQGLMCNPETLIESVTVMSPENTPKILGRGTQVYSYVEYGEYNGSSSIHMQPKGIKFISESVDGPFMLVLTSAKVR